MIKQQIKNLFDLPRLVYSGQVNSGYCYVCKKNTLFLKTGNWLRDQYICFFCNSIPRQRALIRVLETEYPLWRGFRIYESSPSGSSSDMIRNQCSGYLESQYLPNTPSGSIVDGIRCENLEEMSFNDKEFDLIITQDVFEHVLNPGVAFKEINRTLKPGGAHLFTVPLYKGRTTIVRAVASLEGVQYLKEPVFHSNPVDEKGSLVVTDWGDDLPDFIESSCGMKTKTYSIKDGRLGIDGEFLEVFLSKKPTKVMENNS